MNPELQQYIQHQASLDLTSIRYVRERLPDDSELDSWLEEAASAHSGHGFILLTAAAFMDGRTVDARHLVGGAQLLQAPLLAHLGLKMTGDVTKYLMQALQHELLDWSGKTDALLVIAALHRERAEDIPPEVLAMERSLIHSPYLKDRAPGAVPALLNLAIFLEDRESIDYLRREFFQKQPEKMWRMTCEHFKENRGVVLKLRADGLKEVFPEKSSKLLAQETTMRRSVARIGRNDPCHCGSGRKYKQCCIDKDRERLRDSSDIEGVTRTEREAMPEQFLTADRLKNLNPNDLMAIDPRRVPKELQTSYFAELSRSRDFGRAAVALEKVGYSADLHYEWMQAIMGSAFFGRKDVSVRLLRQLGESGPQECVPMQRLLESEDDPAKMLECLDDLALAGLNLKSADDMDKLYYLAFGLMMTKHRALGLLVGRGIIPLLSSASVASETLSMMLLTRERLHLSPDEPIIDAADKLWAAHDEALEADSELREAKELFEFKRREAAELKESLERMQREMKRREATISQLPAAASVAPEDPEVSKQLRRKIQQIEHELNQRNVERTSLRKQLQQKQVDFDALRSRAESTSKEAAMDSEARAEDALLLPQESGVHQPLRLIEFPRNFEQRLDALPRNIGRAALAALGRLAGGEPAAFVGAVRLKACPSVTRQRIGIDHRLLFRLLPGRIEVIDLIPRGDLERKVKTLSTQYD